MPWQIEEQTSSPKKTSPWVLEKAPTRPQPTSIKDLETAQREFMKETIGNIPESAWNYGKSIIEIFKPETIKNLYKVVVGVKGLLTPGEQPEEEAARAVGKYFADRYGGIENLKTTVKTDPVGFMADVSMLLTGAGGVAARIPGIIGTTAKVASKVGGMIEPFNVAKQGLRMIPKGIAPKLYESSAKFSTTIPPAERVKIVESALTNKILPNAKGVEKAKKAIEDINTQIDSMISQVGEGGLQVPIQSLFKEWPKLLDEATLSGKPLSNQKTINLIRNQIEEANLRVGRTGLTPPQLQTLKKKIYKDLESYYEKSRAAPASIEAQKAVARSAKESLENLIPEIKGLNAKEGILIELRDAIEKSAARVSNRDLLGIGIPLKAGGAGMIGGIVGGGVGAGIGSLSGLVLGILDTPIVKSKLAVVINTLKTRGIQVKSIPTLTRLGIYQASEISQKGQ